MSFKQGFKRYVWQIAGGLTLLIIGGISVSWTTYNTKVENGDKAYKDNQSFHPKSQKQMDSICLTYQKDVNESRVREVRHHILDSLRGEDIKEIKSDVKDIKKMLK